MLIRISVLKNPALLQILFCILLVLSKCTQFSSEDMSIYFDIINAAKILICI